MFLGFQTFLDSPYYAEYPTAGTKPLVRIWLLNIAETPSIIGCVYFFLNIGIVMRTTSARMPKITLLKSWTFIFFPEGPCNSPSSDGQGNVSYDLYILIKKECKWNEFFGCKLVVIKDYGSAFDTVTLI